jgi:DNA-binding MarR family transcriptional regulator
MKPAAPDAWRAWQLLTKFFFAQRAHLPSRDEPSGLSPVQCHLLHLMEPGEALPMSQLADLLQCDRSNVTGLVDRLESRGLVARQAAKGDRRVKTVALTASGEQLRARLLKCVTAKPLPLACLSREEQRTLVAILERLVGDRPLKG